MSEQVDAAVKLENRLTTLENGHTYLVDRLVSLGEETLAKVTIQNGNVAQLRKEFDNHVNRHQVTEASRDAVRQDRIAIVRFVVGVYRSGSLPWLLAMASAAWFAKGG